MKDALKNNKKLIIVGLVIIALGIICLIVFSNTSANNKSKSKVFHCNYEYDYNSYVLKIDKYMYIDNDVITEQVSNVEFKFNTQISEEKYEVAKKTISDQFEEKLKDSNVKYDIQKKDNSIVFNITENKLEEIDSFNTDESVIYLGNITLEEKIEQIKKDSEKLGGVCFYE